MGIAIADSVYKGNEVHLILFSHGGDSNSRDRINGVGFCKWHNKYHIPSEEGYKRLTIKKLGRFRVKEFIFAALDLGVQIKNIDICDFYEDKFKETDIKKIVLKYVKMYPNARNNTTSYLDDHKTHKKIGNTLYGLYKSGKIKQVRFFISPSKWENVKGTAISNPKVMKRVVKSISDYSTWKPKESLYAIGYHSAGYLFDVVRKKAVSLYHGPNQ
jgi:LmbE family N-acetylglucosaminyl deacetylase